jgi:hypothetical protein
LRSTPRSSWVSYASMRRARKSLRSVMCDCVNNKETAFLD